MPESDLASVYRNLETLEQIGLVRHVHFGHGPGRYVLSEVADRGYVYCQRCGAFDQLSAETLEALREVVREGTTYEPRFTHFPIGGLCADCRDETRRSGRMTTAAAPRSALVAALRAGRSDCGCGVEDSSSASDDAKLTVATTVAPITSIVANIGGDRVDVTGIVPEGTNSHTFEPQAERRRAAVDGRRRLRQRPQARGPDRASSPRRT